MTADEFRKKIEDFEKNPYYTKMKEQIQFDMQMLNMVEQAKLRLAEMEREEKLARKKVKKFGWINVGAVYDGPHDKRALAEESKRRNGGLVMYATWEEEI
jgi:glutamate mutase epsilon subunit